MSKDEYWVFCKECGDDVCAKVEDAASRYQPEEEFEVLVCPNCKDIICDLAEYQMAEEESNQLERAMDRARGI